MLTEIDLDAATEQGIISEDQALALRNFEAQRAQESLSMAEKFQIFGGLSDIMAATGLAMVLISIGVLLHDVKLSIMLLIFPPMLFLLYRRISPRNKPCLAAICVIGAIGSSLVAIPLHAVQIYNISPNPLLGTAGGLAPAIVCALIFWKNFQFPIIPACMVTLGLIALSASISWLDDENIMLANGGIVIGSTIVLAMAIWWDLTDIRRETERSQIAFWLHCSAGFFLSRGAYGFVAGKQFLDENFSAGLTAQIIIPFIGVLLISLIISLVLDRRSLVFGSIPVTIEFVTNIRNETWGVLSAGLMLLLFTLFWNTWRRSILRFIPDRIAAQLPRTTIIHHRQRPARQLEMLLRQNSD